MVNSESVSAALIFLEISAGESVRMILERPSAWDLDIFNVGSLRDITRLAGAIDSRQFPNTGPFRKKQNPLTYNCLG